MGTNTDGNLVGAFHDKDGFVAAIHVTTADESTEAACVVSTGNADEVFICGDSTDNV